MTGVSCEASVRTGVSFTSTTFGVVCYNSSGTWATAGKNPFYFTVLFQSIQHPIAHASLVGSVFYHNHILDPLSI